MLKDKYNLKPNKSTKDYLRMYKQFVNINKGLDKNKEKLFTSGSGAIFTTGYSREKVKQDVKAKVNQLFQTMFKPTSDIT